MARERYLVHVSEDELKPSESIGKPTTIKGKWQNFWYHNKLVTLIVAFVVIVVSLLIWQLATKEKYDYTVTVVTSQGLPPVTQSMLSAELMPYAQDIDCNGERKILVNSISIYNNAGGDPHAGTQKLMTIIGSGDFMLFAVETDVYEKRLKEVLEKNGDFFRPITLGSGEQVERWTWNASTAIGAAETLEVVMTEDMVWFVRAASGIASGEKNEKLSNEHLALLEAYIAAHEVYQAEQAQTATE